ncbi:MAG: hypothetical protein ABIQ61_00655 [Ornithinibacter sp.]
MLEGEVATAPTVRSLRVGTTIRRHPLSGTRSPTAQQILEERLATGDLTEEEYRLRREVLQGG